MITAAIIGGAAPSAGELIRILVNHPDVELAWVQSRRLAGKLLSDYHSGLLGDTYMRFTDEPDFENIKVVFLTDSDESASFRSEGAVPPSVKIIDLGREMNPDFVYGLPELNRKALVRGARNAVIPSAYAHTIALALLPLAKEGVINSAVHVAAMGPGADTDNGGLTATVTSLNAAGEAAAALSSLQESFEQPLRVVAMRSPLSRGVLAVVYTAMPAGRNLQEVRALFDEFYSDHAFTVMSPQPVEVSEVTNTNRAAIFVDEADGQLIVTVASDSMLKGGAGTAVHVMNLMFGLHERVGLALKH